MVKHLDYGVEQSHRWRFGRIAKLIALIVLGLLITCIVSFFVLTSDTVTALQTPPLDDLLQSVAGLSLPDSFTNGQEEIHGGITPAGYFNAHVTPADITLITDQMRGESRTDMQMTTPPAWARRHLWTKRETYLLYKKGQFIKLHLSPSTGEIEVEWKEPFVD